MIHRDVIAVTLAATALFACAQGGTSPIYRCVDADGRTNIQDEPCKSGKQQTIGSRPLNSAEIRAAEERAYVEKQRQAAERAEQYQKDIAAKVAALQAEDKAKQAAMNSRCRDKANTMPKVGMSIELMQLCGHEAYKPTRTNRSETAFGTVVYWHTPAGLLVFTNGTLTTISSR